MEALIFFAIGFPIAFILGRAANSRGDRMVSRWAAENRLKLIEVRPCRSPFKCFYGPGGTSNVQSLYHVTARDEVGRALEGWLRCGGGLVGLFADKVEFYPESKKAASIEE